MNTVPMSNVSMSLTAEEFVVAETAKLSFNATFAITNESDDAKSLVLEAAKKLYHGDWYVTSVSRDQDRSGIDTVTYGLTIRVPESFVGPISTGVKNINRSGLRFELLGTDFTPTQKQIEDGNRSLRKAIYEKANEELAILNETITKGEDSWLVGTINFTRDVPAISKSNMLSASAMYAGNAPANGNDDEGGVTQKLTPTASVNFTRKIYSRL